MPLNGDENGGERERARMASEISSGVMAMVDMFICAWHVFIYIHFCIWAKSGVKKRESEILLFCFHIIVFSLTLLEIKYVYFHCSVDLDGVVCVCVCLVLICMCNVFLSHPFFFVIVNCVPVVFQALYA